MLKRKVPDVAHTSAEHAHVLCCPSAVFRTQLVEANILSAIMVSTACVAQLIQETRTRSHVQLHARAQNSLIDLIDQFGRHDQDPLCAYHRQRALGRLCERHWKLQDVSLVAQHEMQSAEVAFN